MKKMEKDFIKEEGLQVQPLEKEEIMMRKMEKKIKEEMEEEVIQEEQIVEAAEEMDIMAEVEEVGHILKTGQVEEVVALIFVLGKIAKKE